MNAPRFISTLTSPVSLSRTLDARRALPVARVPSAREPRRASKTLLTGLTAALLCAVACKSGDPSASAPAASAAAAASSGGTGADEGPCGQFVTKLCDKSGAESASCGAAKQLSQVLPPGACLAATKDFSHVEKALTDQRQVCDALAARLCNDVGKDTDSCKMVKEQTPKFPPDRCVQLTDQYDKVLGELRAQEAKNQPLSAELQAKLMAGDAPAFGPVGAKVSVIEFSDFQCPYCSRAADVTTQIKAKYADKVRLVFRQFPLDFHQQAHLAAEAALAAHAQGKFWEFHDLLFKNQSSLDRASLEKYAKDLKLDLTAMTHALDTQTHKASVDADVKLGEEASVNGTPTLFVNGKRVSNPTEFEAVAKMIDEALGA